MICLGGVAVRSFVNKMAKIIHSIFDDTPEAPSREIGVSAFGTIIRPDRLFLAAAALSFPVLRARK